MIEWINVLRRILGVDAIAPWSTPSPWIPSYRRQKGGAGRSISGENLNLDGRSIFCNSLNFHIGDKAYYEKVPLEAVPYSEEYGEYLGKASEYLKEVIVSLFAFQLFQLWQIKIISFIGFLTRQQTRLTILRWQNS